MGSDNARNFCINWTVRVRDVLFLQGADVETWSEWAVRTNDHVLRRIKSSLPGGRTSEMAIELQPEEQVKGQDSVGEFFKSLYGTRKAVHNWKKKLQSVLIEMNFEIGTWLPAIVCCRERDVCGFVHGDDFIFVGKSMQLAWAESRFNEKLILKRNAILGPDDGDDETGLFWEISLHKCSWTLHNAKSVATPSVKVQERTPQLFTKPHKDRASLFGGATIREQVTCLSIAWMCNMRRRRLHDSCQNQTKVHGTCSND